MHFFADCHSPDSGFSIQPGNNNSAMRDHRLQTCGQQTAGTIRKMQPIHLQNCLSNGYTYKPSKQLHLQTLVRSNLLSSAGSFSPSSTDPLQEEGMSHFSIAATEPRCKSSSNRGFWRLREAATIREITSGCRKQVRSDRATSQVTARRSQA